MYIGKLNEKIGKIEWCCKKKGLSQSLELYRSGNPFERETLWARWKQMDSCGLDLSVTLPRAVSIDRVVIELGEKSHPNGISLFDAQKSRCLDLHLAETGKTISDSLIVLHAHERLSEFVLEFDADFSPVIIESIELYGVLEEDQPTVFPTPATMKLGKESLVLSSLSAMEWGCEESRAAADFCTERLSERGITLSESGKGSIAFRFDASCIKNAYRLSVSRDGVTVTASDRRGWIQGVETLMKLEEKGSVPCVEIADDPFCEFRGVHMYLPALAQVEFFKRLIREILVPLGYNFVIMELAGAMEFRSHPEINQTWLLGNENAKKGIWPPFPHGSVADGTVVPQSVVRELVAYTRSFGIDVVPEVQSLSHVQFMTQAFPELAERAEEGTEEKATDERLADVPPSSFYAHSFCPSNPKSYEILFDLLDEVIEVFRPKEYVHMGHDEVYQIGICPRCKDRDPADILTEDINRIHAHLASKGLKMMIWADMLQPCTTYQTYPAIDRIPKDILLLDFIWYFHLDDDIEQNLLEKDFDVLFGNLYSSHFPRYEKRIRTKGIRGGQISFWTSTSEEGVTREGKFYDLIYTAQMLWSADYCQQSREGYDRVISAWIPALRERIRGVKQPSRMEGAREVVLMQKEVFEPTVADKSLLLSQIGTFDSLIFEHCSTKFLRRVAWAKHEVLGNYRICFEDGSEEFIPVTYGGNICYWDRMQNEPFRAAYYRHNGYCATWETDGVRMSTPDGKKGTVYALEWINPKPSLAISSVRFEAVESERFGIRMQSIRGIKRS